MFELKEFISHNKELYEKDVPAVLKEKIADDIKYHAEVMKSFSAESAIFYDENNVYCCLNNKLHSKDRAYMGFITGLRELKLSKL